MILLMVRIFRHTTELAFCCGHCSIFGRIHTHTPSHSKPSHSLSSPANLFADFIRLMLLKESPNHCFWLPSPSTKCINWHFRFWPFLIYLSRTLWRQKLISIRLPFRRFVRDFVLFTIVIIIFFYYFYYFSALFLWGRESRAWHTIHWWVDKTGSVTS